MGLWAVPTLRSYTDGIYISARHVNIAQGRGHDTYVPGNQFQDGVMVTRIPFKFIQK
jgi:hypothetical protein